MANPHQSRERQRPDLQSPAHQQAPAPNEATDPPATRAVPRASLRAFVPLSFQTNPKLRDSFRLRRISSQTSDPCHQSRERQRPDPERQPSPERPRQKNPTRNEPSANPPQADQPSSYSYEQPPRCRRPRRTKPANASQSAPICEICGPDSQANPKPSGEPRAPSPRIATFQARRLRTTIIEFFPRPRIFSSSCARKFSLVSNLHCESNPFRHPAVPPPRALVAANGRATPPCPFLPNEAKRDPVAGKPRLKGEPSSLPSSRPRAHPQATPV